MTVDERVCSVCSLPVKADDDEAVERLTGGWIERSLIDSGEPITLDQIVDPVFDGTILHFRCFLASDTDKRKKAAKSE